MTQGHILSTAESILEYIYLDLIQQSTLGQKTSHSIVSKCRLNKTQLHIPTEQRVKTHRNTTVYVPLAYALFTHYVINLQAS